MKVATFCLTAFSLTAGTPAASAADPYTPVPFTSGWTFTFAPYVWPAGLSGDVGLFGLPAQEVDASISDVLSNFDFGAMAVAEARNGRFTLGTDLLFVKLGTSIDTPLGILTDSIDIDSTTFIFTGVAGYSLIYEEGVNIDVIAGARLWYSNTSFDFNGGLLDGGPLDGADDGDTWIDPVVGIKGRAELGSGFYLTGWGMVGGFGVSSDIMWDVLGGIGYEFSDSFSVVAGYRALGVDYANDGFVYDVVQQGPILGAVFRF